MHVGIYFSFASITLLMLLLLQNFLLICKYVLLVKSVNYERISYQYAKKDRSRQILNTEFQLIATSSL